MSNFAKKIDKILLGRKALEKYFLADISCSNLHLSVLTYEHWKKHSKITRNIKKCSVVFDFTAGDSFTDIYGEHRFRIYTRLKQQILEYSVPLVLGSQTIGPFYDKSKEKEAADIIKSCLEVYVRDEQSLVYTQEISARTPKLTTDVAFFLPYEKAQKKSSEKIKVGFNPSGLLWQDGYRDGRKLLSLDYQSYCTQLLETLASNPKYEVHLIPHCFSNNLVGGDNDLAAVTALHDLYPQTIVAPFFKNAMEVKTYIAQMDVFTGARMHATIAAFSAGIPVIPFSYSRKFEGLFETLSYPYTIAGTTDSTEHAVAQTLQGITGFEQLAEDMQKGQALIADKSAFLLSDLQRVLALV